MRVLIAEDDLTSRQLLKAILKKWGYEVVSTCDGNEAWAAFQAEDAPRLAILDWMMPGLDGAEICRKVRRQVKENSTYLILLTALGRKEDVVAGLQAGADDYLTKPFNKNELRARIQVGQRIVGLQAALRKRVKELQESFSRIKKLEGLLSVCMHCHKIRNDQESWQGIEDYIEKNSDAQFSHSICPECLEKYYPETPKDEAEETEGMEKTSF